MADFSIVDNLTFSLSFYAFATALTAGVLLLNMILTNKASALSIFAFSVLVYVFTVISGRGLFFAEFFEFITYNDQEIGRNVIFAFCGIAGTILVWFLLRRQPESVSKKVSVYVWFYICALYALFSIFLFLSYPFGIK